MNFKQNGVDFLAHYHHVLFSDKLEKGSPSEKADGLRHVIAQLQYARLSGISKEKVASNLLREYQDAYSNIIDSFDEKMGLNNFAEGALNLCSGHKNESQCWKSSISEDKVMDMPGIKQPIKATKAFKDKVLPLNRRTEKPINKIKPLGQNKASLLERHNRDVKMEKQQSVFTFKSRPVTIGVTDDCNSDTVLTLYGNNTNQQPYQCVGNQELFGGGKHDSYQDNGQARINRRSNTQPWQNQRSHPECAQNENYLAGKRKMHEEEDESDKLSLLGNAFRTAKQQLAIDDQKKFGGGCQQNRGAAYGTGKKSLGPRRGLNCKFVPPVMNKEDMQTDGNEAANLITSAVLKTRGSDDSSVKYEGLDEEKMKGIEPKMIELIMNEIMDTGPELTWDDVAGLEFAKKTIKEIVVWPMLRPDIFTGLRGPPKGLLLFGPPGTGKTLIGKCIASQSKSTFFCISASSLTSKWVGEGEKMVRALFAVARAQQPAVVFIDEIDSLLTQRTDGENEASRRIKTEFLVQLDGASTSSDDRILVIGATNRPQEIDEAARRRFVKRLYIPLPEYGARKTIIINLLKKQSHHLEEIQLEQVCERTEGFSGADMATLCREAALGPIRDMSFADIEHISADQVRPIQFCDFLEALETVRPSVSDKDLDLYLDWNNTFGSGSRFHKQGI